MKYNKCTLADEKSCRKYPKDEDATSEDVLGTITISTRILTDNYEVCVKALTKWKQFRKGKPCLAAPESNPVPPCSARHGHRLCTYIALV